MQTSRTSSKNVLIKIDIHLSFVFHTNQSFVDNHCHAERDTKIKEKHRDGTVLTLFAFNSNKSDERKKRQKKFAKTCGS